MGSSLKTLNGWVNQKAFPKMAESSFFSWKRAQHPGRGIFHHSDHSKQGGLTFFYGMDHSMEFRYGLHKSNRYLFSLRSQLIAEISEGENDEKFQVWRRHGKAHYSAANPLLFSNSNETWCTSRKEQTQVLKPLNLVRPLSLSWQ